jgi:hypothetical protein
MFTKKSYLTNLNFRKLLSVRNNAKTKAFPERNILFPIMLLAVILFSSCDDLFKKEQPTKSAMEGVWQADMVVNSEGQDITKQLAFPIIAFHLSSDNTVISTAGPLTMFVVYGQNKYTEIASKIDQVFNYAKLSFNGGEFFVGGGVEDRFTLEMKLEGLPGQGALTTLLGMIGIGNDYLDVVIYHKFMDIKVTFRDDYRSMIWEFDNTTKAIYNTKDKYGNYVLWQGWPVHNFQKCKIYFSKKSTSLKELVEASI